MFINKNANKSSRINIVEVQKQKYNIADDVSESNGIEKPSVSESSSPRKFEQRIILKLIYHRYNLDFINKFCLFNLDDIEQIILLQKCTSNIGNSNLNNNFQKDGSDNPNSLKPELKI
jgi:hypothetical protein